MSQPISSSIFAPAGRFLGDGETCLGSFAILCKTGKRRPRDTWHTAGMRAIPSVRTTLNALLVLLAFTILWKGGKSLESTWLLTGVAGLTVFSAWNAQRGEPFKLGVSATLWWSCMVFVVWTVLAYLLSTTRNYGLDEVLREGSLFVLLPVLARLLPAQNGDVWIKRLLDVIVWTTLVACAVGVAVYVLQPVNRMVGTFFDFRFHTDYWPNAWAEYLLLAWPVLAMWAAQKVGRNRIVRLIALGIVLGCLFLSYSRGAGIAFAGQLILLAVIQGTRIHRGWREGGMLPSLQRVGLLLAIPAVTAGLTFGLVNAVRSQVFTVQSVVEKVTFTAAEGDSSKSERAQFWGQAWQLALERPVVGYGPYSFRFVQPRLQQGVLQTSDHPHNVLLKLASERGFPALILFLVILGSILLPVCLRQFAPERLRMSGLQRDTIILVSVLGVLAHLMIDYNLQFVGIILPLVLFLSILASGDRREARTPHWRKRAAYAEIILTMVFLVVALNEGRYLILSSLGRRAEAAGNGEQALAWYQASAGEWYSRDLLLSQAQLFTAKQDWAQAEETLAAYERENTQDYRLWKLRAQLALAQGEQDKARKMLTAALPRALWNDLSVLRMILERQRAEREVYVPRDAVMTAAKAYHGAIARNEHFIGLSSNVEEFVGLTRIAAQLWPQDGADLGRMRREVLRKARDLRTELESRQPGFLW